MPEEINRQLVGVVADIHCAPTPTAVNNLIREGVSPARIRLTGNTMVEATHESLPKPSVVRDVLRRVGVTSLKYVLVTIHRPENIDNPTRLQAILRELADLDLPVVFPIHPRTAAAIEANQLTRLARRLRGIAPVDHQAFLALASKCALLVSDSGGVQEESTVLKRPVVVVRNSTERPEAIDAGFARLVRPGPAIGATARSMLSDSGLLGRLAATPSPYGDGHASERIVAIASSVADSSPLVELPTITTSGLDERRRRASSFR
jgi:UDP-N-acetylglucosamine 2-epimerase (non-hydrolysing)